MFQSACANVLNEEGVDLAPLKSQIANIETSWDELVKNYEIKSKKGSVVERSSHSFHDRETSFSEWLTEAESQVESLSSVPIDLKEAENNAKQVKVKA